MRATLDPRRPGAPWRAAALMVALTAPADVRAQDTAGYVASVNGTWYTSARPAQRVSAGRVMALGEEVWAAPRSSAGAYLNVVLRDGSRLALNCAVPGDCDRRHTLRVRNGLVQGAARMVDAVLELVRRRPEVFVSLIARADGPGPTDAVVEHTGGIDVSPALAAMGAGRYQVATEPLQQGPEQGQYMQGFNGPDVRRSSAAAGVMWVPGQRFFVGAGPPGLYVLYVKAAHGGQPGESWVLAVPPGQHARIAFEFADARQLVSTWTGVDAAHDARMFLRAYLVYLAGVVPPEGNLR